MTHAPSFFAALGLAIGLGMNQPLSAQAPSRTVHGIAIANGVPIAGVNVFDIATLAGDVTKDDGRFAIPIADPNQTSLHLVTRHIGFTPLDTTFALAGLDSLVLVLHPITIMLPISVQAGRYTANAERTTTLTPLEVASLPGSNADINGAIKTLPGVQNVDEGTGLFVRGGDFTETRIFVDGAPLFTAYQFEAPTGSVAGTINPFLTSSIAFSSGGFGAEWGNALSGVVDLRTQSRPAQSYTNVNGSILNFAIGGGIAGPHGLGFTGTVGATNLGLMLDVNGNPRGYTPAPHGQTASALGAWDYSRTGGVKIFGLVQTTGFGIPVDDPAYSTTFISDRSSDILVASWRDSAGVWRPFASLSTSGSGQHQSDGGYNERTTLRSTQARLESPFVLNERLTLTAGGEVERLSAVFSGTLPANSYDPSPNAPTTASALNAAGTRDALFASIDTRPTGSTEVIAGMRSTRSGFSTGRSTDPRLSVAWIPRPLVTITGSWGIYHQIVDPAFLDRLSGASRLPALGANMAIAGVQIGEGLTFARLEAWSKRYDNLVGLTRSYETVAGLDGRARGADFFGRMNGPMGSKMRLTVSLSRSRRTDPNTGLDALAPFDVTHSITGVVQKDWTSGWSAGVATRLATGHPFTDVQSATFDAQANVYVPTYAAPDADRLPSFSRTDVSISKTHPFGASRFGVVFVGINNVLNQLNTFSYTWSPDYSQRIPVRSAVNRTFFIGANLVLLQPPPK